MRAFSTTDVLTQARPVLFDREKSLETALAGLLARGHLLIEDLPGVGKTSFALVLAKLLGLHFRRLQMTNDLLPADVLGSMVFSSPQGVFEFRPGPVFTEVLLVDELNRASPRTQSAFLEAMEERAVSVDGVTRSLPAVFFVLATQNPEDQVGTSALPEGQLDRFMMSLQLGFPSRDAEMRLLQEEDPREKITALAPLANAQSLRQAQEEVAKVSLSPHLAHYVRELLEGARRDGFLLSPRAGQHLARVARAFAWMAERDRVLPEDVKRAAPAVWGHRTGLGARQGAEKVAEWLQRTPIPL
ncbi:MAG: AAA family ATPase [Bdellovibrionaceae bacterium]|nr:AAA family ATPase [Pseudobdellovibrionaceae bacterium]MBX3033742.1 AAA family ATPase [Pseudobdellovibrionaceae bacterium]